MIVGINPSAMHFKNEFIENEYGIKANCAAVDNCQVNSISENIHKFIVNLVITFDLKKLPR